MTPEEMQAEMERLKTMGAFGPQQLPQMPQMPGANYQPGAVNNIQSAVNQSMMPAATIPQAMQPMQPLQMPQAPQAPQEKPGLLSRIGSGIQDFVQDKDRMMDLQAAFNSMRYAPDAGIQQAYADRQKMRTVAAQANQTIDRLKKLASEGDELAGQAAAMIEANPAMASEIYGKYVASTLKGPGSGEVFGTTVRTYTKDGKVVPYVVSNLGNIKEIKLPTGSTVSAGLTEVDQGDQVALLNDQGQIVQVIPKNVSEAAGQKEFGTIEVRNIMEEEIHAKTRVRMLENHLAKITGLLSDPSKLQSIQSRVGAVQGKMPAVSSSQILGESYINQVKGQTFLRAFESIKGGGQITETEGAAATAALNRLNNLSLSNEDYVAAMKEASAEMQALIDLEKAKIYAKSKQLEPFRGDSPQVTERRVE
jgi:hypothetical protein